MSRSKHCADNERIKRRYLQWLKEAKGYGTASIDMAAAAISGFVAGIAMFMPCSSKMRDLARRGLTSR